MRVVLGVVAFAVVAVFLGKLVLHRRYDVYAQTEGFNPAFPAYCVVGKSYVVCNEGSKSAYGRYDSVRRIDGVTEGAEGEKIFAVSYVYSEGKGATQGEMKIVADAIGERRRVPESQEDEYIKRSLLSFLFAPTLRFDE